MACLLSSKLESQGGVAQFLIESAAFGPLIKGQLLSQASEEFVALPNQLYETTDEAKNNFAQR